MGKMIMYLLFMLLFLIIAISGCSSVDEDSEANEKPGIKPDAGANVEDTDRNFGSGADDNSADVNDETSLPSDVVNLLKKGQGKLKNINYEHRRFPDNQELHIISILGDKIVYVLPESQAFFKDEYFDTVYMDLSEKSAVAYCEHKGDQKCPSPNKEFKVEFEDYIGMIIYDGWIDKILRGTDYVNRGKEQLDSGSGKRDVYVFDIDIIGVSHRISVDLFSGIPMKIEKYPDSDIDSSRAAEEYNYEKFSFNKLKPDDMKHKVVPE